MGSPEIKGKKCNQCGKVTEKEWVLQGVYLCSPCGNLCFTPLLNDEVAVKRIKIETLIRNIRCEQSQSCLDDSVANILVKQLEELIK